MGGNGKVIWYTPTMADRRWALELIASKCMPTLTSAEITGPNGAPIQVESLHLVAHRVAASLASAAGQDNPALSLSDESLRALQAVNYMHHIGQSKSVALPKPVRTTSRSSTPTPQVPFDGVGQSTGGDGSHNSTKNDPELWCSICSCPRTACGHQSDEQIVRQRETRQRSEPSWRTPTGDAWRTRRA